MSKKPPSHGDCLNCIGKVSHNASTIDMMLCNVFRVISGLDAEMSIALYYTPSASTVKFGLITNLMKKRCNEDEQMLIKDIITKAEKTNTIRNALAHSFLHITQAHGLQMVRLRDKQSRRNITTAYLESNSSKTAANVIEVGHLYAQLCEQRGEQPQLQF